MENKEKEFNKYKERGSLHWREMVSRDPRVFNAYQEGRYGWILKTAGNLKNKKVLDVGSGDGSFTYQLARAGADVVGIDNEERGMRYALENLKSVDPQNKLKYSLKVASAYALPFKDAAFDVAVCCDVVEHLNEPEKMFAEVARILKPGGMFILTTPYRFTETPMDPNHVKEYYPEEMNRIFKQYFATTGVKATHHMLWRSIYSHAFRPFGNRPIGRWVINMLYFIFGWNPFMFEYPKTEKWDAFTNICAWGIK